MPATDRYEFNFNHSDVVLEQLKCGIGELREAVNGVSALACRLDRFCCGRAEKIERAFLDILEEIQDNAGPIGKFQKVSKECRETLRELSIRPPVAPYAKWCEAASIQQEKFGQRVKDQAKAVQDPIVDFRRRRTKERLNKWSEVDERDWNRAYYQRGAKEILPDLYLGGGTYPGPGLVAPGDTLTKAATFDELVEMAMKEVIEPIEERTNEDHLFLEFKRELLRLPCQYRMILERIDMMIEEVVWKYDPDYQGDDLPTRYPSFLINGEERSYHRKKPKPIPPEKMATVLTIKVEADGSEFI